MVTSSDDTPTPPSGDRSRTALALYRVSRGLKSAALPHDLTWEKLSALCAVARCEPASISEISALEEVSPPTMSRTVAALQRKALVRCVANRDDGRSVLVMSTAKGRAVLDKYMSTALTQIADVLHRLETDELEALADTIREIRETKKAR